jgi:hypothetical protein
MPWRRAGKDPESGTVDLETQMKSLGVQEFRSSGVQEFRSSGVQEFRSSGWEAQYNCKKKRFF